MPDEVNRASRLASQQYGLVSSEQLKQLGVSRGLLRARLDGGEWTRVHRGVFKLGPGEKLSLGQSEMAALLLVGPCAALSHVSAARRLGLDVPPRFGVQLTIPHDVRAPPLAGVEIFRSRDFDFSSITLRQGFRVTRLGRTMLDLSSGLERDWLRASLRSAMRQQRANLDLCWRSLNAQGHGHHGAKTLRELLWETEEDGEFSDSALEALTMELGLATGRRPLLHHRVQTQALTAEIDFAWPERKLAVEVDGWKYHATKDAFETDRERDVALFFSGWSVLRFTWRRVTAERDGVIHQLMAALDRAPVLTAG